ncbi:MAG: hypothetical protein ABIQ73_21280 [Acidimicrobiales bacterium]
MIAEATRRVPCVGCGRARYFRPSEVFADNRVEVELRKPCPHCGDTQILRISRFAEVDMRPINDLPGLNVPWVLAHLAAPIEGDDSDELSAMFEADQSSRRAQQMSVDDDRTRLHRVLEMLDRGELRTPRDYQHAAMVLQHGQAREHFHLAFELARRAAEAGHDGARYLAAAALDRWLMNAKLPQKFGTQFQRTALGRWELWAVDPTTTDEERDAWSVPRLALQMERLREMNAEER